jgi:hypothetical protein
MIAVPPIHSLARQPRRILVAMQIAIGARDGEQRVIRRCGRSGLFENGDRFARFPVLLQQGGEIHRDEAVIDASGQQRAQFRLRLGDMAGTRLQHRGPRRSAMVCASPGSPQASPTIKIAIATIDRRAMRLISPGWRSYLSRPSGSVGALIFAATN